jgi:hypothetical protein
MSRPGVKFGMSAPRPDPASSTSGVRRQQRTEFVILFIWEEPTLEEAAAPAGQ